MTVTLSLNEWKNHVPRSLTLVARPCDGSTVGLVDLTVRIVGDEFLAIDFRGEGEVGIAVSAIAAGVVRVTRRGIAPVRMSLLSDTSWSPYCIERNGDRFGEAIVRVRFVVVPAGGNIYQSAVQEQGRAAIDVAGKVGGGNLSVSREVFTVAPIVPVHVKPSVIEYRWFAGPIFCGLLVGSDGNRRVGTSIVRVSITLTIRTVSLDHVLVGWLRAVDDGMKEGENDSSDGTNILHLVLFERRAKRIRNL